MNTKSMNVIKIELVGLTEEGVSALFNCSQPPNGLKLNIHEGVEVENRSTPSFGIEPVSMMTVFVSTTSAIASSILANAIYDWLKDRVKKIRLNGEPTVIDRETIKQVIEELKNSEEID